MNIGGIFGEILGAIIGIYIIQNIPNWHLSIITSAFSQYAPIATTATILTMLCRICMYALPFYRTQKIFELGAHLISIISLYMLILIFPFNFTNLGIPMLNTLVWVVLVIALVGTGIAAITSFVKFFVGK